MVDNFFSKGRRGGITPTENLDLAIKFNMLKNS